MCRKLNRPLPRGWNTRRDKMEEILTSGVCVDALRVGPTRWFLWCDDSNLSPGPRRPHSAQRMKYHIQLKSSSVTWSPTFSYWWKTIVQNRLNTPNNVISLTCEFLIWMMDRWTDKWVSGASRAKNLFFQPLILPFSTFGLTVCDYMYHIFIYILYQPLQVISVWAAMPMERSGCIYNIYK